MVRKSLYVLSFLLWSTALWAQIPGKIAGVVTDKDGNPLIGVNIVVEGTYLGASTDEDGQFLILNVPPGTYTLTASYIGYQTMKLKKVMVQPDLTTRVKFVLKEKALELGEAIEVVAERPLIQKDATAKITTMSAEENPGDAHRKFAGDSFYAIQCFGAHQYSQRQGWLQHPRYRRYSSARGTQQRSGADD